jgi:hypothetical protein
MFQFPSLPGLPYEFRQAWHGLPMPGSPIRISTGQCLLAAHRGFSQLATSFFVSWRQGIRHVPLLPRLSRLKLIPRVSYLALHNPNSRFFCKNASLPLLSCQRPFWWRRAESNRRLPACKAGALPTEPRPHLISLLIQKD